MTALAATPANPTSRAELEAFRALVKTDLERVNKVIFEQVKSDIELINQVAQHIIAAGGKRLRPSLTIAAAKLCGYEGERHIRLAASVEFLHTATLLHDDVVDESAMRRGEATANALWGNKSSVLVGDFLLSRAFQLMVGDGSLEVLKVLSDAATTISAGEVQQLMVAHDLSITQQIYEEIIAAKTAVLFAAACELGPILSGQETKREALRRYGYSLGMAFQLIDDALDYAANETALGKTLGDDFRDGKVTMPVLVAYQQANTTEKAFWERTVAAQSLGTADLATATHYLQKHKAFEAVRARAEHFMKEAIAALAGFEDSQAKATLVEAAEFTLQRTY